MECQESLQALDNNVLQHKASSKKYGKHKTQTLPLYYHHPYYVQGQNLRFLIDIENLRQYCLALNPLKN